MKTKDVLVFKVLELLVSSELSISLKDGKLTMNSVVDMSTAIDLLKKIATERDNIIINKAANSTNDINIQ